MREFNTTLRERCCLNKKDIDIKSLAQYIGLPHAPESWSKVIDNNLNLSLDWLTIEKSKEILNFYGITDKDFRSKYFDTIEIIKKDPKLHLITSLFYETLYSDGDLYKDVWNIKTTETTFNKNGSLMINVVALLGGYGKHQSIMISKKYDEYQITEQIKNINLVCVGDSKTIGINGIRFTQMAWGSYFINGKIIQCGRLQYEISYDRPIWLEKYVKCAKIFIYIHIPKGDRLSEELISDSMAQAKIDIPRYFNIDMSEAVFLTESWLLSDDLDGIIDQNCNIMRFKHMFCTVEQKEKIEDFLNFIFNCGIKKQDYKDLAEKTSIQRGIKTKILNGTIPSIGMGYMK